MLLQLQSIESRGLTRGVTDVVNLCAQEDMSYRQKLATRASVQYLE